MRTAGLVVVVAIVAAAVASASGPLLALRVETEPVRAAAGETVVEVAVQVAPEDRERLGSEAWLRMELTRGDATVDRIARPVPVDANGRAVLEVAWPPGAYQLRVDVESADGAATGFWVSDLEVPRLDADAASAAGPAAAGGAGGGSRGPEGGPETSAVAGAEPAPAAPGPQPEPAPEPVDEQPPPPAELPRSEPPSPPPERMPPGSGAMPPGSGGEPVTDEPGEAGDRSAPAASGWESAGPGRADLTAVATREDRPVLSLSAADLRLTAAGVPAEIVAVEGGLGVPLQLAVVTALSSASSDDVPRIGRALSRAAARGSAAAGRVVLVAGDGGADRVLEWREAAVRLPEILAEVATPSTPDLVTMVSAALDAVEGRPGRRFVVVVTDGRDDASRSEWRDLLDRASESSAPILAVGLWTPDFERRTRNQLSDVAGASGGRVFYVQGVEQLQGTLERYGDLVAASSVIRFERPPASGAGPVAVTLEPAAPGVEVVAPPVAR